MGKTAFLFSGQGAQHVGMGMDLYHACDAVRRVFDRAETLRPGTLALLFSGDEAQLMRTQNTQPCLYLADLAAALALREQGLVPDACAGFSLGELPALAFAGAFSYDDGFLLACARGAYMAEAAAQHPSAMAAVLRLEDDTVRTLCAQHGVYPVNFNSDGQVSVSGTEQALAALQVQVEANGGRLLRLAVSGGFHCPFMDEAAEKFGQKLTEFSICPPQLQTYSNYTGAPYGEQVRALLREQINHSVNWKGIIRALAADGVDTFVEVGAGITLRKLVTRILGQNAYSVETAEQAQKVCKELIQ